jgi:hypoxanthine phosphoribosyltransferase
MSESYDYSRREGVQHISWEDFHGLCRALAEAVAPWQPEIILGVARGGLYPATLISHILQVELYPIRLTRRVRDVPTFERPQWRVRPPDEVAGRRVLVVDEICSSGETLAMVRERARVLGAEEVRSAVLYSHTWGTGAPDYIGLISDALLINPWDREVFVDGAFRLHPEYVEALGAQGRDASELHVIPGRRFALAKG